MSKNTPDQSKSDGQTPSALGSQQNLDTSDPIDAHRNSPLPPPVPESANTIWRGDPPPTQNRRLVLAVVPVVIFVGLFISIAVSSESDRPELVADESGAVSTTTTSSAESVATTSTPTEDRTSSAQTPGADPAASEGVTSVQWIEAEQMIRVDYRLELERDREASVLQQRSSGEDWREVILLEGRSGHVNVPVDPARRGELEEFRVQTRYSDGSELVTVPRGVFSSPTGTRRVEAASWATWSSGGSTGWRVDDGHLYVGWMDSVRGTHFSLAVFLQENAEGYRPEQVSLRVGRSTARGCTGNFVLRYAPGSSIPDSWTEVDLVGETVVQGPVSGQYLDVNLPSEALDIIENGSDLLIAIVSPNSDRASTCLTGSTYRVLDAPSADPESMVLSVTYR